MYKIKDSISSRRGHEANNNSSTRRTVEVNTITGEGKIVNAGATNFLYYLGIEKTYNIFDRAHNDGTIMTLACTSKNYNKAVHDFLSEEILDYKTSGELSNNPFEGIHNFIHALSQNLNVNIPVNLYQASAEFSHTEKDSLIASYMECFHRIKPSLQLILNQNYLIDNTEDIQDMIKEIVNYYQCCLDCSKQNIRDLFNEQELEELHRAIEKISRPQNY